MNLLALSVVILLFQVPDTEPAKAFTVGADTYSLTTRSREVSLRDGYGWRQQLVLYSVYKNEKFLHPFRIDAGRFFSCPFDRTVEIKNIFSEERQIGWMLVGGGICGNTFSYRIELIIPKTSEHFPEYHQFTFISKVIPNLIPTEKGAKVCFFEQNWGGGGTATSFRVPKKFEIDVTRGRAEITKGDVFENLDYFEYESGKPGSGTKTFLGPFVAGLEAANPDLMRYALQYYDKDDRGWYDRHFKDGSLEGMKSLVTKVEALRSLHEEVKNVVNWDLGPQPE